MIKKIKIIALIISLFCLVSCSNKEDYSSVGIVGEVIYLIDVNENTTVSIIEPHHIDDKNKSSINDCLIEGYNKLIDYYKNANSNNSIIIYYDLTFKEIKALYNNNDFKKDFINGLIDIISDIELTDSLDKNLSIYKKTIRKYFN
jgi:hypothetical protein